MNTTQIVLCLGILLYVATCLHQWRRLSRGEKKKHDGSKSSDLHG